MLLANVGTRTLRARTPLALTTGLAVAAMAVLAVAMYSTFATEVDDLLAGLPEAYAAVVAGGAEGGNLAVAEMANLVGPIGVLVVAIAGGAAAVAGEERDRTADLLFAHPVRRRRVVAAKAAVLVGHVALTAVCFALGVAAAIAVTDSARLDVVAVTVHLVALGAAFAMFTLAVATVTGSTTAGVAVGAATAVLADLAASLLPLAEGFEDLARWSPWYYYNGAQPLTTGVHGGHVLVLAALAGFGLAVALVGVEARDLRAGAPRRRLPRPTLGITASPGLGGIFTRRVTDRLPTAALAGGGLGLLSLLVGAMYPGIRDTLAEISEGLPPAMLDFFGGEFATPVGWMNAEVLSVTAPLVLVGVAVSLGAGAVAGQDRRRTLGLLLALPVTRTRLVLEELAAMAVLVAGSCALCGAGILAGSRAGGLGLGGAEVAGAMVHLWLLAVLFGAVASAVGAAASQRAALGAAWGLAIAAYLTHSLLAGTGARRWAVVSPWHHFIAPDPLADGADPAHLAVLAVATVAAAAVAVALARGREVRA